MRQTIQLGAFSLVTLITLSGCDSQSTTGPLNSGPDLVNSAPDLITSEPENATDSRPGKLPPRLGTVTGSPAKNGLTFILEISGAPLRPGSEIVVQTTDSLTCEVVTRDPIPEGTRIELSAWFRPLGLAKPFLVNDLFAGFSIFELLDPKSLPGEMNCLAELIDDESGSVLDSAQSFPVTLLAQSIERNLAADETETIDDKSIEGDKK